MTCKRRTSIARSLVFPLTMLWVVAGLAMAEHQGSGSCWQQQQQQHVSFPPLPASSPCTFCRRMRSTWWESSNATILCQRCTVDGWRTVGVLNVFQPIYTLSHLSNTPLSQQRVCDELTT
ncbi:hypothetical protein EDC04DRAFT_2632034 [Pisolithus marmoratus]|nr:hypothetical protein EDC04DRAFT_2632034 [Pisolithus marmoratus]